MANTSDNFFSIDLDTNTAMRDYLNARYGTTNADVQPLVERFLAEIGGDRANGWKQLVSASQVGTS